MGDTTLACFGQIPWIDRQGVRRAQQQQSNNVDNDGNNGDSDGSNADNKDGGNDGNNNKGDVDGDCSGNNNYNNYDVNDNNNNDGMTTMQWRRRQWNNNDMMVMGLQALCHPSEATINLC